MPQVRSEEVVQIGRDPFAREDHVRRLVPVEERDTCKNCDCPGKFQYGTESDGINTRPFVSNEIFCGIECFRSYSQ